MEIIEERNKMNAITVMSFDRRRERRCHCTRPITPTQIFGDFLQPDHGDFEELKFLQKFDRRLTSIEANNNI